MILLIFLIKCLVTGVMWNIGGGRYMDCIESLLTIYMIKYMVQESFNTGDYINSVINRQRAETISNVLYPDDRSYQVLVYIKSI